MFARRLIFFRLRAFISGCLAALANSHLQLCCLVDMVLGTGKPAPPFPARVMPMEIGISFSCPKKALRLSLLRTLAWPRASPDECSLSGQAFAVALVQTRFKSFSNVQVSVATKRLRFGMTERSRRRL
ncbi:hypothetical protein [Fibrobacter sp. UWB10]|uniref:hypothetical protein n=1 Tax=Fibrobacter sp. UWB10 TaxID=1896201 RepID=UPI0024B7174B|nr:hypothetical protein [Fibrobacter sp. UWB10]